MAKISKVARLLLIIAGAPMVAAGCSTASSGVGTTQPPTCTAKQLEVHFFGGSAAAGTALSGYAVADSGGAACVMRGWISVKLVTAGDKAIPAKVARGGFPAGPADHPVTVTLDAKSAAKPLSEWPAGFVIASDDMGPDPQPNPVCPVVGRLQIKLPGGGTYSVAANFRACGGPPPAVGWLPILRVTPMISAEVLHGLVGPTPSR